MKPITFACRRAIPQPAEAIADDIADMSRWPEFNGYAFLPGIERAEYETRTAEMVGSRIRVRNRDGSGHVEVITEWQPGRRITMRIGEFTPPLSRLASHFIEDWRFEAAAGGTGVTRSFDLYPARPLTRPFLWLISLFFRRAIDAHLADMDGEAAA
jgi:hypothetical protein